MIAQHVGCLLCMLQGIMLDIPFDPWRLLGVISKYRSRSGYPLSTINCAHLKNKNYKIIVYRMPGSFMR